MNDLEHTLTYTIIAGDVGAFPNSLHNYRATVGLHPITEGGKTFAYWTAAYECSAAKAPAVETAVGDHIFIGNLKAVNQYLNKK